MAEVYPQKAKHLARMTKPVNRAIAQEMAVTARAILKAHHHRVNAKKGTKPRILVRSGRVDAYVILEDPDGGALAIEYGRSGGTDSRGRPIGAMAPIAPLRGSIGGRS